MPSLGQTGVSPHRRWLLPAIVMLVGGALAIWGIQRENARLHAVETQIMRFCRSTAAGSNLEGAFNPGNPTLDSQVREALRSIIDSPDTADMIQVKVKPGDSATAGPASARATHTATIVIGDQELLGLRIQCADPGQPITVLGYWTP